WGETWRAANSGITIGQLAVAGITFSPITTGKVYAAIGNKGPGGLVVSIDGGQTWSVRSQYPRFSGGAPDLDGRSTGNLIAVDPVHGNLYAASYDQGVLRSADDGATWTSLGLASVRLRGLAL